MARRTVNEPALLEMATQMQQFCDALVQRLEEVVDELRRLDETWSGVAFDAFLQRLTHWQAWAREMGEVVAAMQRNAHTVHRNYAHNNAVNTAMWTA